MDFSIHKNGFLSKDFFSFFKKMGVQVQNKCRFEKFDFGSSTDLEAFLARVLLVIMMIANPQVR